MTNTRVVYLPKHHVPHHLDNLRLWSQDRMYTLGSRTIIFADRDYNFLD